MKTSTGKDECNEVNGLDLSILQGTIDAIIQDGALGVCKFRASNEWVNASHNCTTVSGFYGAKQEISHETAFELHADEPPILAGQDMYANPVEHLLHALAGCVTTSMVAHAAVRGIEIEALTSELEGDIDIRGFLGLASDVPKGFTDIRVKMKVKTDAKNLEALKTLAVFSPVYNSLMNGVKVDVQVVPK